MIFISYCNSLTYTTIPIHYLVQTINLDFFNILHTQVVHQQFPNQEGYFPLL
jgi:hypothetical protein